MRKIYSKCMIGCLIALLFGSLLLCFETLEFLLPFTTTLMIVSGVGVVIFGVVWLYDIS